MNFPNDDVDIHRIAELAQSIEAKAKGLMLQRTMLSENLPNVIKEFQTSFGNAIKQTNKSLISYSLNYQPADKMAMLYCLNGSLEYIFVEDLLILKLKPNGTAEEQELVLQARFPQPHTTAPDVKTAPIMWALRNDDVLISTEQVALRALAWLLECEDLAKF